MRVIIERARYSLRNDGFKTFVRKVRYRGWRKIGRLLNLRISGIYTKANRRKLNEREMRRIREEIGKLPDPPLISVVMPVYNVAPEWLHKAVDSVRSQLYPHWELCIADDASPSESTREAVRQLAAGDGRIKTVFLKENGGISRCSNAAAALAEGHYIAFLDHDDELAPDALYEMALAICRTGAELLYSDEELISEKDRIVSAHFKPDFSPDLLYSHNYVTHLMVLKTSLFREIGGFDSQCDGAQDYDLVLAAADRTDRIQHVPRALYRWRCIAGSTSVDPGAKRYAHEAGRRALQKSLRRKQIDAEVLDGYQPFFYRVRRRISGNPLVSIIVPFRDQPDMLRSCFESVLQRSTYRHFEIIGISNNSRRKATLAQIKRLARMDKRVRFEAFNEPFNYSRINNFAVRRAAGEHIVLMNNDIEIITPEWIEALLEHSQRSEVGAVGAKLIYADNKIQHAGVIIGIAGFAGHAHRHLPKELPGYMSRAMLIQNVSAVTAALMMVRKSLYLQIGGLDEENLSVALNDVDFCLRLRQRGLLNVYTPYCEAYHYESASRGYEETPEKKQRFRREVDFFQRRWRALLDAGDPYYNPNLSLNREDFAYR